MAHAPVVAVPPHRAIAYRPEIDGLRALAVGAVMIFHADLGLPGGYVGVDVFFVISGFLITQIIRGELREGQFALLNFWERRVRRIIPALALMLIVVTAIAWAFVLPWALARYSASLAASALFVANLYFWRQPEGYFGLATEVMPLAHLWSLAIEEQFYLAFPLLLWIIHRFRPRWTLGVVAFGLVGSLVLCAIAAQVAPVANFYLLPTRAWELLAGAVAALAIERSGRPTGARASIIAATGLATVIACIALFDPSTGFPFPGAIPVVAGTAAFLIAADPSNGVGRVFALRPAVALGLISYGAYLWHQPLLAFLRTIPIDAPTPAARAAALIVALGAAAISYRLVERPLRRAPASRRTVFALAGVVIVPLAAIGGVGYWVQGLPGRFSAEDQRLMLMNHRYGVSMGKCLIPGNATELPDAPCRLGSGPVVEMALIGDSHAAALAPELDRVLRRLGRSAVHLAHAGCPPHARADLMLPLRKACAPYNTAVQNKLVNSPDITTVIMASRLPYWLTSHYFDNREGGVEPGPRERALRPDEAAAIGADVRDFVTQLLRAGKTVILVYPIPETGWEVPTYPVKSAVLGRPRVWPTTSAAVVAERTRAAAATLDALGAHPRLMRIYPAAAICDTAVPGRCITAIGQKPLYFDDDHPTTLGARVMLRGLETMLARLPRP